MATTDRKVKIDIQVEAGSATAALKAMAKNLGLVTESTKKMSNSFSSLQNIAFGFFSVDKLATLANMADEMLLLSSRISAFEGSAEKGRDVIGKLAQTANATKTSVESLATTYFRLAASTKETGVSTELLLETTEALQNTFRLSGATTAEATNTAIQLAQGLASGQLRGQELRSVLEQNVVFGGLLSKTLGVTRGELYKLAMEGKLGASKVFKTLLENSTELRKEAEKLGQTFGQTVTVALNGFKLKLLDIVNELDLNGKFAKGIETITENIELLIVPLTALAAIGLTAGISALVTVIAGLSAPILAVGAAVGVLTAALLNLGTVTKAAKEFFDVSAYTEVRTGISDINKELDKYADKITKVNNSPLKPPKMPVEFDMFGKILNTSSYDTGKEGADLFILRLDKMEKEKQAAEDLAKAYEKLSALAKLNLKYAKDNDAGTYFDSINTAKITDLTTKFKKGQVDLQAFKKEISELEINQITRELNQGAITLEVFNERLRQTKVKQLQADMEAGAITINEYADSVAKLRTEYDLAEDAGAILGQGARRYLSGIETLTEQSINFVEGAFKALEDSLAKSLAKGKLDLEAFGNFVAEEIARIVVRTNITQPIANLISAAIPAALGGTTTAGVGTSGGGGSASSISTFQKTGGAGYASTATSSSAPIVNINNYSNSEVAAQETTDSDGNRILEIMITSKVKEGISTGLFDKTFQQSYGLQRKGV